MAHNKSLDEYKLIAAVLHDVNTSCGAAFNSRALRLTLQKVRRRLDHEGLSFLTKTLPKLGKAFDKALSQQTSLNASELRFDPQQGSQLPRFLGELFNGVLDPSGLPLIKPNAVFVQRIRQVCYLFYKYELGYSYEEEQKVVSKFKLTDSDLLGIDQTLACCEGKIVPLDAMRNTTDDTCPAADRTSRTVSVDRTVRCMCSHQRQQGELVCKYEFPKLDCDRVRHKVGPDRLSSCTAVVTARAKKILSDLFARFDPTDIYPKHGPGAVSTKEQLSGKYCWTNVSARITSKYPLDAYFYASLGHFCDELKNLNSLTEESNPAKVVLVPKDSRGPRLISCEPLDFQWIQQGLGRSIVELVESHDLTKYNVFFTNQSPNQCGALLGSSTGKYATLDLNEASDRVSLRLVHLLFPPTLYEYLEAARSSSTVLPDGEELKLRKFAPMGSCLCFPIMALTIWAILTSGAPDEHTRERILVYGDDVIVPTAYADDAIELLESFGLKINRDKSCTKGLFRESCGVDAFEGINVTPVRLRTVWSSSRSPDSYASWVAYANSFYQRKYFHTYDYIVGLLSELYRTIPDKSLKHLGVPYLMETPETMETPKTRVNPDYQSLEYNVWVLKSPVVYQSISGWSMLLRYFAEKANSRNANTPTSNDSPRFKPEWAIEALERSFSVREYTRPRTSMLVRRWR